MLTAHGERAIGDGSTRAREHRRRRGRAADAPAQELVYLGGPVTGPGYDYHQFAGRVGVSARVEWRTRVPFVGLSLGPYGKAPASATLAPFATVIYSADAPSFAPDRAGWYPAVGVGALFFFDLVRIDVARGLRRGRWTFSLDVTRELWPDTVKPQRVEHPTRWGRCGEATLAEPSSSGRAAAARLHDRLRILLRHIARGLVRRRRAAARLVVRACARAAPRSSCFPFRPVAVPERTSKRRNSFT